LNPIEECWSKIKDNIRRNPLDKADTLNSDRRLPPSLEPMLQTKCATTTQARKIGILSGKIFLEEKNYVVCNSLLPTVLQSSLGMNNIIDITDKSPGSQLHLLKPNKMQSYKHYLQVPLFTIV
jgi:hypothetical protein